MSEEPALTTTAVVSELVMETTPAEEMNLC
jgi:hypothetical protein